MAIYKSRVQSMIGGEWLTGDIDGASMITPHLSVDEIANPSCEEEIKLELPEEAYRALACWEFVRQNYGKAIPVNCGYRSPTWNKQVGGVDNSLHLKCCAFDCQLGKIKDKTYEQFYLWVYAAAAKYDTQAEIGRYSWGLHIGFGTLDYTEARIYAFDKR